MQARIAWSVGSALLALGPLGASAPAVSAPDLSGVWGMVQHDHLGAPFFIPRVGFSTGRWDGDTLVIETTKVTEWQAPRWPHSDQFHVVERWYLKDASDVAITGLRPERPPPKIEGQVLINEMTMNDAAWYADTGHKVTVVYRRLDDVMLEGNCAEGIWMEALEATAAKEGAGTD